MAGESGLSREPYLACADGHLELRFPDAEGAEESGLWISLDDLARRTSQGGLLLRACGLRGAHRSRVLDPMAGLGVDGLVLATRGCQVILVERNPLLAALLRDLVQRSGLCGVSCVEGDGFAHLLGSASFDVVYLDPMFPERRKRALPGKRMQQLARLARPDPRPLALWIETAIARAKDRVVLKRRRRDPQVRLPDWQIVGRTVRFDVYRGAG